MTKSHENEVTPKVNEMHAAIVDDFVREYDMTNSRENQVMSMVNEMHTSIVEDFVVNSDEDAYQLIQAIKTKMNAMLNDLNIVSEDGSTFID